jgi:aryl-alcohol dehydrogenase-like predicted oxidoreductase
MQEKAEILTPIMDRRSFLKVSLAGLTTAIGAGAFPHHLFAAAKAKNATDTIKLGASGVTVSRLALGTGTGGWGGKSNQTRKFGVGGMADYFKLAYDNGVTFWDSADQYGSHPHLREALKSVPRDKVTILTKTHATTEKEMRADLDRFRKELGVDHIDILLLHCMTDADWPERKKAAMNVISEAREKGIVRAHGVSCHSLEALQTAARTDWVQVDLARINPAGAQMDSDPATVLRVLREMKAKGKGIIGMKILGAGALRGRADECFQWAMAQNCVDCFTLGMESVEEFKGTLRQIPAASVRA